jgi:beta-1,4-mannosyl-glycoprotein beta-1,4-N-acetylglucosaminyltransferase
MIYDCFLFSGEAMCFSIRLHELGQLEVKHIVVQADKTFTNKSKEIIPLPITNVVTVNVTDMPDGDDPWVRERWQRNCILRGLEECQAKDDDIVIISDADEIPKAEAVARYRPDMGICALIMDKFGYWLNCVEGFRSWEIAKIMTYGRLKQTTPDQVRNSGPDNKLDNAGWHYSYLGDKEMIVRKLESFSHTECNRQELKDQLEYKIKTGQSLWGEDYWTIIPIDERAPKFVFENQEALKGYIHHD